MKEMKEEELNQVSGGDEMSVDQSHFMYTPGDRVRDVWNEENGVGEVTKNVGVSGHYFIDEVHFQDVNQTYNAYEGNLRRASLLSCTVMRSG